MDVENISLENRKTLLEGHLKSFRQAYKILQLTIDENNTKEFSKSYSKVNDLTIIILELLTGRKIDDIRTTFFTFDEVFTDCEPVLTFVPKDLLELISDEDALHLVRLLEEIRRATGGTKIADYFAKTVK